MKFNWKKSRRMPDECRQFESSIGGNKTACCGWVMGFDFNVIAEVHVFEGDEPLPSKRISAFFDAPPSDEDLKGIAESWCVDHGVVEKIDLV